MYTVQIIYPLNVLIIRNIGHKSLGDVRAFHSYSVSCPDGAWSMYCYYKKDVNYNMIWSQNHNFLSICPRMLNLNLQFLLMWAFWTLYGGSFIDHFKLGTWALTREWVLTMQGYYGIFFPGWYMRARRWSVSWMAAPLRRMLCTHSGWRPWTRWGEVPTACQSPSLRGKHVSSKCMHGQETFAGVGLHFHYGSKSLQSSDHVWEVVQFMILSGSCD